MSRNTTKTKSKKIYEMEASFDRTLLQMESFAHQALQAGFIDNVVSEFFVGKHGEGGTFGSGHQFRSFFDREARVLADDRHHHVDHHLETADFLRLLKSFVGLGILQGTLVSGVLFKIRCAACDLRCGPFSSSCASTAITHWCTPLVTASNIFMRYFGWRTVTYSVDFPNAPAGLESNVVQETLPMAENATPQPNENLVRVFETEQEAEAMVVRGLLESAGIDAEFGESENAEVLPVGAVGVLVREEDAEKARRVLEEYRRSPQQEDAEEAEFDEAAMESPSEDPAAEK